MAALFIIAPSWKLSSVLLDEYIVANLHQEMYAYNNKNKWSAVTPQYECIINKMVILRSQIQKTCYVISFIRSTEEVIYAVRGQSIVYHGEW